MLLRRFAVAAAAVLLITGCSGDSGAASSGSASGSVSASTAATVDLSGAKLTVDGFGDLKLGQPLPAGYEFEEETQCKGRILLDKDGKPTVELWTAESGEINTIIATDQVETDKGLKLGAEANKVAAAYPDAETQTLTGVEATVVKGESSALVIEAVDGKVAFISVQPLAGLHAVGPNSAC